MNTSSTTNSRISTYSRKVTIKGDDLRDIIDHYSVKLGVVRPEIWYQDIDKEDNNKRTLGEYDSSIIRITIFRQGLNLRTIKHEFIHHLHHMKMLREMTNPDNLNVIASFSSYESFLWKTRLRNLFSGKFMYNLRRQYDLNMIMLGYPKSQRIEEYNVRKMVDMSWDDIKLWFNGNKII